MTNSHSRMRVVGRYPLLLTIFAVVVLLFISKDPYLHDMGNHTTPPGSSLVVGPG